MLWKDSASARAKEKYFFATMVATAVSCKQFLRQGQHRRLSTEQSLIMAQRRAGSHALRDFLSFPVRSRMKWAALSVSRRSAVTRRRRKRGRARSWRPGGRRVARRKRLSSGVQVAVRHPDGRAERREPVTRSLRHCKLAGSS